MPSKLLATLKNCSLNLLHCTDEAQLSRNSLNAVCSCTLSLCFSGLTDKDNNFEFPSLFSSSSFSFPPPPTPPPPPPRPSA